MQYILVRKTFMISAISSGNISKYEFLTGNYVLLQNDLLEKAATIKRFEYSPSGKELKAQNETAKKQYQILDKIYEYNETINKNDKTVIYKTHSKSDLIYDSSHTFYKYYSDIKKSNKHSLKPNHSFLSNFLMI